MLLHRTTFWAYATAVLVGGGGWLLLGIGTTGHEGWDNPIYFTVFWPAMGVLALFLGYFYPRRPWRWGVIPFATQALIAFTSNPTAVLLPLGLVLFGVLSLPCIGLAYGGVYAAARRSRSHFVQGTITNMSTPWMPAVVARQFATWGLVGAAGLFADLMVLHSGGIVLLLPVVSCLVGGALAGRVLDAGAVGAFACAVTFSVGGLGALLSAVTTQAMGGETALDLVWFFGVYYAAAFGAGAAIGFAVAPRHGLPVFVAAVQWFSFGGAVAGAVVGMLVAIGLGHAALSVAIGIAADAAFATGGAGVAYALGRQADTSHADGGG